MATYHTNRRIKWDDFGMAHHANGRTAFSLGIAYHANGRTAYSLGSFYDKAGKIIPGKSTFSVTLGPGIVMHLIPNFKITVYDRKIS